MPEDIWQQCLAECRAAELPCVPSPDDPWLSIEYLCQQWLLIETILHCRSSSPDS